MQFAACFFISKRWIKFKAFFASSLPEVSWGLEKQRVQQAMAGLPGYSKAGNWCQTFKQNSTILIPVIWLIC